LLNCTATDLINYLDNDGILYAFDSKNDVYFWKIGDDYFMGYTTPENRQSVAKAKNVNRVSEVFDMLLGFGVEFQVVVNRTSTELSKYFGVL